MLKLEELLLKYDEMTADRPKKLLIVIGKLDIGGTENHLLRTLPAVADERLQTSVFVIHAGGALEPAFEARSIEVVRPPLGTRGVLSVLVAGVSLLVRLARERPDIVHFYLPEAYLLGGLVSLPFPAIKLMSRRSLNAYQRKRPYLRPVERFLHRRMHGIVTNAECIRRELEAEGAPSARLTCIYNGIEPPPACGHKDDAGYPGLEIGSDTVVILCIANLIPYKNHRMVVDAFAELSGTAANSVLVLAGADRGAGDALRARCDALGITDRVRFLGSVTSIDRLLAVAHVGVLGSDEEGLPNAVLEYMSAALPVVATRVGGVPELVVSDETGVLVAPGDAPAMSAAIARYASDVGLRKAHGRRGRQRALEVFSLENCVRQHAALYRAAIDGRDALARYLSVQRHAEAIEPMSRQVEG